MQLLPCDRRAAGPVEGLGRGVGSGDRSVGSCGRSTIWSVSHDIIAVPTLRTDAIVSRDATLSDGGSDHPCTDNAMSSEPVTRMRSGALREDRPSFDRRRSGPKTEQEQPPGPRVHEGPREAPRAGLLVAGGVAATRAQLDAVMSDLCVPTESWNEEAVGLPSTFAGAKRHWRR